MGHNSWSHRLARLAVRPLIATPVTPNQLTSARLVTGIAACAAFGLGDARANLWGGVLWLVSAFLDRADGELARLTATTSASGHRYDFICDVAISGLFFVGLGIGLRGGPLGWWAGSMGLVAGGSIVTASILSEKLEKFLAPGKKAYAGAGGFDFDDVFYAFAPVIWLGWGPFLLIGATIGGPVFVLATSLRLRKMVRTREQALRKA